MTKIIVADFLSGGFFAVTQYDVWCFGRFPLFVLNNPFNPTILNVNSIMVPINTMMWL
jgi:hypothetical protein